MEAHEQLLRLFYQDGPNGLDPNVVFTNVESYLRDTFRRIQLGEIKLSEVTNILLEIAGYSEHYYIKHDDDNFTFTEYMRNFLRYFDRLDDELTRNGLERDIKAGLWN